MKEINKPLEPFKFWAQKVLPAVYDDSLSYYEVLCKVVEYLNETIDNVDNMHTEVTGLHEAYVQLQEYVNTYFDNLDVQGEINAKLDEMAIDGTLSALISPFLPELISEWLSENLTPTSPPIDSTLSISGAAADAKKTGDEITDLKRADDVTNTGLGWSIDYLSRGFATILYDTVKNEYVNKDTGAFEVYSGWSRSDYIPVTQGERIDVINTRDSLYNAYYDANKTFISAFRITKNVVPGSRFYVPENAAYMVVSNKTNDLESEEFFRPAPTYINTFQLNTLVNNSTELHENDDLFALNTGSYYWRGVENILNNPTTNPFRLVNFVEHGNGILFSIIYDYSGQIYTNTRGSQGGWGSWNKIISNIDYPNLFNNTYDTQLNNGSDLYNLDVGTYYSYATDLINCPTTNSFKLWIFNRTGANNKLALLMTSDGTIYTNAKISTGWKEWRKLVFDTTSIPTYYETHMAEKALEINTLHNNLSDRCDSFIFLTDYHIMRNARHSASLIRWLFEHTGLKRLCFGGDAYQTYRDNKETAEKYVSEVYSMFHSLTPLFYPVLGNHEWNHYQSADTENIMESYDIGLSGVFNYCLSRCTPYVKEMSIDGNYIVDNERAKIRYIFLQYDGDSRPTPRTFNWLGEQLEVVPNGYYVMVLAHYANMDGHPTPRIDTYGGRTTYFNQMVADLLQAYNTKTTFIRDVSYTANGVTVRYNCNFDYSNADGNNVICILGGHWHEDDAKPKSSSNVLQVLTTGDLYRSGSGIITYEIDGTTYERTPGTIREQAFDVVSIDIGNRKVYFTRIGAGANREFSF